MSIDKKVLARLLVDGKHYYEAYVEAGGTGNEATARSYVSRLRNEPDMKELILRFIIDKHQTNMIGLVNMGEDALDVMRDAMLDPKLAADKRAKIASDILEKVGGYIPKRVEHHHKAELNYDIEELAQALL